MTSKKRKNKVKEKDEKQCLENYDEERLDLFGS